LGKLKDLDTSKKLEMVDESKSKIVSVKLRGLDIVRANQVWSTDITYIKIAGGMVYLAAVIDWYSKAVLSWRISNTMDTAHVMDVLPDFIH